LETVERGEGRHFSSRKSELSFLGQCEKKALSFGESGST